MHVKPGSGLGLFAAQDSIWEGLSGEYSAIYESVWVRVPTTDFELQKTGVKFLGFVGVAQKYQGGAPNQIYFFSDCGDCVDTTVKPDVMISVIQQNHVDRRMDQNVAVGRIFTFGDWHQVEYVMTLNTIGLANGTLKVWVNGTLTHEYSDIVWRDIENPSGFHTRHWDPIWGRLGGSSKSRDDFLWIAHLYISGIECDPNLILPCL